MSQQQVSISQYPTIIGIVTMTTATLPGGQQHTTRSGHLFPFPVVDNRFSSSSGGRPDACVYPSPFKEPESHLNPTSLAMDLIPLSDSPTRVERSSIDDMEGLEDEEERGEEQQPEDLVQEGSSWEIESPSSSSTLVRHSAPPSTTQPEADITQDEGEVKDQQSQHSEQSLILNDPLPDPLVSPVSSLSSASLDLDQTSISLPYSPSYEPNVEDDEMNSNHLVQETEYSEPQAFSSYVGITEINNFQGVAKLKPWGTIIAPKPQDLLDSTPDDVAALQILRNTHPHPKPLIVKSCLIDPSPRDIVALASLMPPLEPSSSPILRNRSRSSSRERSRSGLNSIGDIDCNGGTGGSRGGGMEWADIYGEC